MKKRILTMAMAAVMTVSMSLTAWAWDTNVYLYEPGVDENGYIVGWVWQDMNGDGVFESYYYSNNSHGEGYLQRNTTTPDGYTVNDKGQWTVDGVVQTKTRADATTNTESTGAVSTETVNINGVNHSVGYDTAHPLKNVVEQWNLKLTPETNFLNYYYICDNDNIQAMLTGQMEYYHERTGNMAYLNETEQALYQWFCNWLNGMDFEHMSEMERAREIQKVLLEGNNYNVESNRNGYYAVLIDKKSFCAESAMTAMTLAKALGLRASISGTADHAHYYIQVDGVAYFGSNGGLDLSQPSSYIPPIWTN